MTQAALRPAVGLWVVMATFLLGPASPAPAAVEPLLAQSRSYPGVDELWRQYPLDKGQTQQGGQAGRPSATPREDALPAARPQPGTQPPVTAPEPSRATAPTPAPTDQRDAPAGSSSAWPWIGLGLALLLTAGIATTAIRVRRGNRRRSREFAEGRGNLYAEGFTDRDGIGAFHGFVSAVAGGSGPKADRMLCLDDPAGEEPLWVRRSEVSTLRSVETGAPQDAPGEARARRFRRSSARASRPRSAA